ncbi:MAG: hypothetical protein ACJARI_004310 [Bacteroidia bacterium]|jgi:hypothetical protein
MELSFGITESARKRYRVTAFVKNVADENYCSSVADLGLIYGGAPPFFCAPCVLVETAP